MHQPVRRFMLAGLIGVGLPLALFAGTAAAAPSTPANALASSHTASPSSPKCIPSPYTGQCNSPTVSGKPWYSDGVNIRALATSDSAREGGLPGSASTTVYCYTVGQFQSNPPYSDDYWDYVDYNGVTGYISDAFLNTGGTITSQVYPCVSGLHGGS